MSVIVIGAGQAAVSFAAKFRSLDTETPLTIIGDEPYIPYQRPPLSKKYALGAMGRDQLFLRPAAWYRDQNINLKTGIKVQEIDRTAKEITLSDGTTMPYSQLVLATGAKVRALPEAITKGLKNILYFRTLNDAEDFGVSINKHKRVLIVGGGYIGLEAAAVCRAKGMDVTVLESAERILQRVACQETSSWFKKMHEDEGVTILEGVGLSAFEGDGAVKKAHLSNGHSIDIDMAIVGIGIVPNTELARSCGLSIEAGILVNAQCQTDDPVIYAAGDCAEFAFDGQLTRLESVPNAIDQATVAAENIANAKATDYLAKPWFWSDQYDVKLQIAGLNRGYDHVVTREIEGPRAVAHFYYAKGQLIAIDALNAPRIYMIGKRIIDAGKTIPPEQAADKDFDLKSLM